MVEEKKPLSRSEREAKIKDKAGLVVSVFAAVLAANSYISNNLSSTVLNNTIKANDVWNFYEAKSIKSTAYNIAIDNVTNAELKKKYEETMQRYESDPKSGEGMKELMVEAKKLEAERDLAKQKSPWISFAGTAMQLAIVLVSASIIAVSNLMFWSSFGVMAIGLLLMSQGIWMWMF
jgi:Domain of unknown function (DUF4337)